MIPGAFSFKGKHSTEFKIISKSTNRALLPSMRARSSTVYGKDGLIDYGDNNYEPRLIIMHLEYIGTDYLELRSRAREIAAWLSSKFWGKLIFDDEPEKYYMARVYDAVALESFYRLGRADITFICQPFAYMLNSTGFNPTWEEADFPWVTPIPWIMSDAYTFAITSNSSLEFLNQSNKDISCMSPNTSKFEIKITGSFTALSLELNGNTLSWIGSVSNKTIVIDSINMEVTLDGANALDKISGDLDSFLSLMPGINELNVTGTGLNISILVDFLPEWI